VAIELVYNIYHRAMLIPSYEPLRGIHCSLQSDLIFAPLLPTPESRNLMPLYAHHLASRLHRVLSYSECML
jgi:hypothetical protein